MLSAADLAAAAVSGVTAAAGCAVAAGAVVPGWDDDGALAAPHPASARAATTAAAVSYRRDLFMAIRTRSPRARMTARPRRPDRLCTKVTASGAPAWSLPRMRVLGRLCHKVSQALGPTRWSPFPCELAGALPSFRARTRPGRAFPERRGPERACSRAGTAGSSAGISPTMPRSRPGPPRPAGGR